LDDTLKALTYAALTTQLLPLQPLTNVKDHMKDQWELMRHHRLENQYVQEA